MTPLQIRHIQQADIIFAGKKMIWGAQLCKHIVNDNRPTPANLVLLGNLTAKQIEEICQIKASQSTDMSHDNSHGNTQI